MSKSYDGRSYAVHRLDLHCPQGEMLALLGPSGCGKSSTLKMVAGIEPVTSGVIQFDGADVTAHDAAARNVAMVFEDYALYPHLSAFENIAFPLRVRGVPRELVRRKVGEAVDLLGLQALLDQPVRALSGGAQQRVAIGRALVRDPALVMFDEPLSHLDADQKVVLRTEIRRLQSLAKLTSVLVTHDQTEAMAMADRIAVMNDGVLQQVGTPEDLYVRPANRFVAGFIGESPMNLLDAVHDAAAGRVHLVGDAAQSLALALSAAGGRVDLGIRPEDVVLGSPAETGPALRLDGEVLDRECCGDREVLTVQVAGGRRLHAEQPSPSPWRTGDTLSCTLPAARLHVFDAESGVALNRGRPC
ncbi:ABC transporter ATP-binding protein [Aquabacterium sp. J223]|uniref:ABC transporter ATP-binding protein n=1 Tax=Aquabacterium sp. J223 TaxID=2898431 RepID=UPI0021ADDBFD|nr:ABC transporter ATP-binding protein [Aquabacterium sp. J223]UUX96460.1 ABC transporter ATP-binding protein [Aquabacterium sp. J223]